MESTDQQHANAQNKITDRVLRYSTKQTVHKALRLNRVHYGTPEFFQDYLSYTQITQ